MAFNDNAKPKAKPERFKLYLRVGGTDLSPTFELQGKGIGSYTFEQNEEIKSVKDVLGGTDNTRSTSSPVLSGIQLYIRKDSALAEMIDDAYFTRDYSKLDEVEALEKFEYRDGATEGTCKARKDTVLISINSFVNEAEDYLHYDVDFHFSNRLTFGTMPIIDGSTIEFTPDEEEEEEEKDTNL